MVLSRSRKISYRQNQQAVTGRGAAIDFAVIEQRLDIIVNDQYLQCIIIELNTDRRTLLPRPMAAPYNAHPVALQSVNHDSLAIFYVTIAPDPLKRLVAFYSQGTQQFTDIIEFDHQEWDPAGRSFLVTPEWNYIFPHDRALEGRAGDSKKEFQLNYPLLDLYSKEGHKVKSFGSAQHHENINMAAVLNRGYLGCQSNGDLYFVFEYPYRLLKFKSSGFPLWDKSVELPFQVDPPVAFESKYPLSGEIASKNAFLLSVTYIFSRPVKDISVGSEWIAVLAANSRNELSARFGSRIDRFNFEGDLIDSHQLDQSGCLIYVDTDNFIWVLNDSTGEVSQYQLTKSE